MLAVTDQKLSAASLSSLRREGFEAVLLPPADYLQETVSSHTDMLFFIGFGRLFCHRLYYERNATWIDRICLTANVALTVSNEPTGEKYPLDVLFNACMIGSRLICNRKTVSKLILTAAEANGYEIVHVPQGYTKCSIAVVSENAIITADRAIAMACASVGIDVLQIREGYVSLPPYSFGFIGGASGSLGDKVYFCGSLSTHPDGDRIIAFCQRHGKIAVSLSEGELQDVGSLFFIKSI